MGAIVDVNVILQQVGLGAVAALAIWLLIRAHAEIKVKDATIAALQEARIADLRATLAATAAHGGLTSAVEKAVDELRRRAPP